MASSFRGHIVGPFDTSVVVIEEECGRCDVRQIMPGLNHAVAQLSATIHLLQLAPTQSDPVTITIPTEVTGDVADGFGDRAVKAINRERAGQQQVRIISNKFSINSVGVLGFWGFGVLGARGEGR